MSDCTVQETWNLWRLSRQLRSPESTIQFCKERGLIAKSPICRRCRRALSWFAKADCRVGFVWRCHNRRCSTRTSDRSICRGSWFAGSRMSLEKVLVLTYCWAAQMSNKAAIKESSLDDGVTSKETVVDWFTHCREVCLHVVQQCSSTSIGGPGLTVEIDESKFGRRKYNRGRLRDGKWVLGGICRETKEVFFVEVENRNSATLIPLIKEYVAAGSLIVTDCWRAYDCLSEENFQHLTVNHSLNFVDPASPGVHTQNIECQWWQIKRSLPSTHTSSSDGFGFYLAEYMWRRKHSGVDHFTQILADILLLYAPPKSM